RLMLFGDSFSEYRTHLLTGLLAETFAETAFIWSSAIDWGLVQKFKPNVLLTELAERFMEQVPNDDLDLNAFASHRLEQYRKSRPDVPGAVAAAKSEDMSKGFESAQQCGVASGPFQQTLTVAGKAHVFEDAVINVRTSNGVLFSGLGLRNCAVANYQRRGERVTAQFRLPIQLVAVAIASGAKSLSVISSASPFPLGTFSLEGGAGGAPAASRLSLLRSKLHRSQWGIDGVLVADGKAHVIGWALAPVGESAETPAVRIDDIPAETTHPSFSSRANQLYWFAGRPDAVSFYAVGELATQKPHFLKIEISFPGDPEPSAFWRRFPVYNWLGPYEGMAAPPPENIQRVSGAQANVASYFSGGYTDFKCFEWAAGQFGRGFGPGTRVLDWGCGCGRISRHVIASGSALTGIDIDKDNVQWCDGALPGGTFRAVPLMPPTALPESGFDVIISSSVLSHLKEGPMQAWLSELHRLLSPNGVALLSYNGDGTSFVYGSQDENAISKLTSAGFFDDWRSSDLDGFIDDREYYRLTLMTDARAEQLFKQHFDMVGIVGSVVSGHQNVAVLRKRSV
ncbi:MAG: hypothetical protein JWQ97_3693, partial [Phenylobacterium sp.]|nr:hypothetical protein [Phenylobacterium sp.]